MDPEDIKELSTRPEVAKSEVMGGEESQVASFGAVALPPWLLPLVESAIEQYGPGVVDFIRQAAVAGIDALAEKFHLVPKS